MKKYTYLLFLMLTCWHNVSPLSNATGALIAGGTVATGLGIGGIIAARAAAKAQKESRAKKLTKAQKNALHKAIKGQRKLATILGILAGGSAAAGVLGAITLRSRQQHPTPEGQHPNAPQNPTEAFELAVQTGNLQMAKAALDATKGRSIPLQDRPRYEALSLEVVLRLKDQELYEEMQKRNLIFSINQPEFNQEYLERRRLHQPITEAELPQQRREALAQILIDQTFPAGFKQLLFGRLLEWAAEANNVERIRELKNHGIMPTAEILSQAASNEATLNCLLENIAEEEKQKLLKRGFMLVDEMYKNLREGRIITRYTIFELVQNLENICRAGLNLTKQQKGLSNRAFSIALHAQLQHKAADQREPYLRNMVKAFKQAGPEDQSQTMLTAYIHKLTHTRAPIDPMDDLVDRYAMGARPQHEGHRFSFYILKELAIMRDATMFEALETLLREAPQEPEHDTNNLLREGFINLRAEILWHLARDYSDDIESEDARHLITTLKSANRTHQPQFDISLEELVRSNNWGNRLQRTSSRPSKHIRNAILGGEVPA